MKPTRGFIVKPTIDIASPIWGMHTAGMKHAMTTESVTIKFY